MTNNMQAAGLTPVVRRMSMFVVCVLLFEVLLILLAPRLHSGSVLKIAKDSALLRMGNDSWFYMAQGDLAWRQHPNAIYETAFFDRGVRFIYPPTSLLFYRAWLAARVVHIRPFVALKITLFLAFLGTWLAACAFFFDLFPMETIKTSSTWQRWAIRVLMAILICVFLPLINALFLGQAQTLLNFFLILSALLWLRGCETASGIFIGLTCWLKPQMALFLVWGLLRRRWNFFISLAVMLALGLALSCIVFGIHNTVEYLTVLQYLSHRGDALFTNQSLNGLLHRQMHVGSPVTWIYGYPPYNSTIYWATMISSALLLLAALVVPALRGLAATPFDFLVFAMATTMASPIAWEHHYGVFFLVFLLWMPTAFRSWRLFFGLLGIYLLMTDNWAPLTSLMYTPWTFLISHVYFGGLLLFMWTLFRGKARPGPLPRGLQEQRISVR
ncbi:MAG TPA: glycosyltransferase family 87 protein [Acidobacteriaceae bacterium]|nr:glycosyltransferase family 87 protein [Acidobacteriaceae bacterium]